jgi:hypothetical protein
MATAPQFGKLLTNHFVSYRPMLYSDCMAITFHGGVGVLVYIGHDGKLHEIIGGNDGQINLRKLG